MRKGEAEPREGMRKERVGEREEESQKAEDDEGRGNRRSMKNWTAAGGRGVFTRL